MSKATSSEAIAIVISGAFIYGFFCGKTKQDEKVDLTDLIETPITSSLDRSVDGIKYTIGTTVILTVSPATTPLLAAALLGSTVHYFLPRTNPPQ